jgi:hypothetical protein
MSEVETIRELCQEIAEEKDPEKTRLLLIELREMTALLSDDTRLRRVSCETSKKNRKTGQRVECWQSG